MEWLLKKLIRVGFVSSVNAANGAARVTFADGTVSSELLVMKKAWPVTDGEQVLCLFLPTGLAQGFVLGAFYTKNDPPAGGG